MSTDNALASKVIQVDLDEVLQKAMHEHDPEAALIVAIMFQATVGTLNDLLDEYEHEPEQFMTEVANMVATLSGTKQPTIN